MKRIVHISADNSVAIHDSQRTLIATDIWKKIGEDPIEKASDIRNVWLSDDGRVIGITESGAQMEVSQPPVMVLQDIYYRRAAIRHAVAEYEAEQLAMEEEINMEETE